LGRTLTLFIGKNPENNMPNSGLNGDGFSGESQPLQN
jgi:hypothetical protein